MNFLFDIGHPAHVHLFKNYIKYLKICGHHVVVTTRKKDVTEKLLDHETITYNSLSTPGLGFVGMFRELILRNRQIFELHKKHKFDASFGTSVSIGFLNQRFNVPAYNFNEDDDKVVFLYSYLAYPFATKIINPSCIEFSKWKAKRVLIPSYHELAYLHPNNFNPNIEILKKYGLEKKRYIIARFSAFQAHHDTNAKGITNEMWEKIEDRLFGYRIIKSFEKGDKLQIEPWDMHDVLAFAKMIISDSQTMTIEGAVLGIPSVRINTFINKSTVINELENKYNLAFGYYPNDESRILNTITHLATGAEVDQKWEEKRALMLSEKIDYNQWMIDYFNQEIPDLKK